MGGLERLAVRFEESEILARVNLLIAGAGCAVLAETQRAFVSVSMSATRALAASVSFSHVVGPPDFRLVWCFSIPMQR